jgi:hypothetical protein
MPQATVVMLATRHALVPLVLGMVVASRYAWDHLPDCVAGGLMVCSWNLFGAPQNGKPVFVIRMHMCSRHLCTDRVGCT